MTGNTQVRVSIDEQVDVLMSNTGYGDDQTRDIMRRELRERLIQAEREGRPLRVYCGYDPRTTDLHLGHTITMRKLRQFQEFGHHVIFLIGSFTSLIGDPDDTKARDILTPEKVAENAQTYQAQAFKILDAEKTEVRHNSEWLAELGFLDVIKLAQHFTVQQFLAREGFSNRLEAGNPIYLHEFFYPLMQGYDPIGLKADVQVGGQDQLFNLMAGRQLMSKLGVAPQIVIAMGESLPGTDGVVKMSKSKGNHIPLLSESGQMYTSLMKLPDFAMPLYFKLLLGWSQEDVDDMMARISRGEVEPQEVKAGMALDITTIFHGREAALQGREFSRTAMQEGGIPEDIAEHAITADTSLVDLLVATGLCKSKGDAKRQIQGGGVRRDSEKVTDADEVVQLSELPTVLQYGKRHFVRIVKG
ncbi:MAG: tyrosine--tRNA ligase [Chloroflexi bacterium]|nr:tyrosine--tRNA ligase [Chloroflexota bacterium]